MLFILSIIRDGLIRYGIEYNVVIGYSDVLKYNDQMLLIINTDDLIS